LHRSNCGARYSSVGSATHRRFPSNSARLSCALDDAAQSWMSAEAAACWRQPGHSSWSLPQEDVAVAATAVSASLASLLGVTFVLYSWACRWAACLLPEVGDAPLRLKCRHRHGIRPVAAPSAAIRIIHLPFGQPSETPAAAASASLTAEDAAGIRADGDSGGAEDALFGNQMWLVTACEFSSLLWTLTIALALCTACASGVQVGRHRPRQPPHACSVLGDPFP
jgi:hypothetical protein